MTLSHIEDRLRTALNEYVGVVPLANRHGLDQAMLTAGSPVESIPPRGRRRLKISRLMTIVVTTIGLAGTATGLAAAAGAFDGSAHHAAAASFKESVLRQLNLPDSQIRREMRKVAHTFRPKDVVLRATNYGPDHSTFTVWTYSDQSSAPWCYILVQATSSHTAHTLGWGCQLTGSFNRANAGGYAEWPCSPGPHDRGVVGPNYFVVAAQVPRGVTSVILHGTPSGSWGAPVTHGWFIAIASNPIHWPTQITYVGRNKATSAATLNIGGGSC
jgi:hypothetical protein